MLWMQVGTHLYCIWNGVTCKEQFMEISSIFSITYPWHEITRHIIISPTKERKKKIVSMLQQSHLQDYQCIHGGSFDVVPPACVWFHSFKQHCVASTIVWQNICATKFFFCFAKVKCEWIGVVYTTSTCKTNFKHTNNAHSNTHSCNTHSSNIRYPRRPNTPLGEFQDSLNDVMHEENSPNKIFDALVRISNIGLLPRNIWKHMFKEKKIWKKMAWWKQPKEHQNGVGVNSNVNW